MSSILLQGPSFNRKLFHFGLSFACLLLPKNHILVSAFRPPQFPSKTSTSGIQRHSFTSSTLLNMGPPLPSTPQGTSLLPSQSRPKIQIDVFLELLCPFSCRMYNTLYDGVLPELKKDPDFDVILHQTVQPWHSQCVPIHEAALALKQEAPEFYAEYVKNIYAAYTAKQFTDEITINKTRAQLYEEAVALLPEGVSAEAAEKVKATLMGGGMVQEIKWACKYHRARGVHVTPTVFINGIEAGAVSSGWTKEQWLDFLKAKGSDNFTG